MTAKKDIDTILPDVAVIDVEGIPARVNRIRMRELIMATRVIQKGIGGNLQSLNISTDMTTEDAIGLILVALPDAVDETMELLSTLIKPIDAAQHDELAKRLANPAPAVVMDAVAAIVEQEWDDWQELVGKGRALLAAYQKRSQTGR